VQGSAIGSVLDSVHVTVGLGPVLVPVLIVKLHVWKPETELTVAVEPHPEPKERISLPLTGAIKNPSSITNPEHAPAEGVVTTARLGKSTADQAANRKIAGARKPQAEIALPSGRKFEKDSAPLPASRPAVEVATYLRDSIKVSRRVHYYTCCRIAPVGSAGEVV